MLPLLSICIPTFNRCSDLSLLLQSIVNSAIDKACPVFFEVVVSDNASTDGTGDMVRSYFGKIPSIRYVRNDVNLGFARNLNQVVELGLGEYCWLMGSDEKVLPCAIVNICNLLIDRPDVIIGNAITNKQERLFLRDRGTRSFDIKSIEDCFLFLSQCNEISAAFAFISTIVVRRSYWIMSDCNEMNLIHPYTHMLRLTRLISKCDTSLIYMDESLVQTGHNVNEFNSSVLPHVELDLLTIDYICRSIFGNSMNIRCAYLKMFRNQYTSIHILKSRIECDRLRWSRLKLLLDDGYPDLISDKKSYDKFLFFAYMTVKKIKLFSSFEWLK